MSFKFGIKGLSSFTFDIESFKFANFDIEVVYNIEVFDTVSESKATFDIEGINFKFDDIGVARFKFRVQIMMYRRDRH